MAEVTRSRKHHVAMGNYEWVEFAASVKITNEDMPDATEAEMYKRAEQALDLALRGDLEMAASLTAEEDSYVLEHPVNKAPLKKGKN